MSATSHGSQQLRKFRIARRDGFAVEDAAAYAGIPLGEAKLHEDCSNTINFSPEQVLRFWSNVDMGEQCWVWRKSCLRNGYGQLSANNRKHLTHRVAYQLHHNVILSADKLVCHHCDNPPCCNPAHLFVGSSKDNTHDMIAKGRTPRRDGMRAGNRKLSEQQVRLIRSDSRGYRALGRVYGVDRTTIRQIKRGSTWALIS